MDDSLDSLNAQLRAYIDTRPWVTLTHRCICTNCGSESNAPAKLMREEKPGHYVRAAGAPPPGIQLKEHIAPAFYARCEKCSGERPLKVSVMTALEGAGNDSELAQRLGHILADWFRRKRAQPATTLEWEE